MLREDGGRESLIRQDVEDGEAFFLSICREDVTNLGNCTRLISGKCFPGLPIS